ncbi:hypothetical protein JP75_13800 [Devosia riboflavina]|uniref:DUF3828 domain-containing protein n=1 Tax=Devosia riboflavina TaxID=46914 RepID=A0A087M110_9HYPH|nr:hypothetical protein [Devosia riboflavina]KFL30563.1 hypothetical protein JP75_13800 [Devosia riboflavina]
MRIFLALTVALAALALPVAAQEAKTKTPPQPRTYVDSIDRSTSEAALRGFVEAYAAGDYYRAWLLLSPEAKTDFTTRLYEFNEAQLFPGMEASTGVRGPGAELADDIAKEIYLEGALIFDRTMVHARSEGLLPFDLEPGAFSSATFEHEDQGRYMVEAKGRPAVILISTIRLSDGSWRVERVVWATSDPEARPWGFK